MTLIAIGGAEDKTGSMTVLKTVLARTGKSKPIVHVITTATGYPDDVAQTYRAAFGQLGITPEISHIKTPEQADEAGFLARIAKADVVFFSGGDQSKLADAFNGTQCLKTLKSRHEQGAVIAGTSAGAAAMAAQMITGGRVSDAHKKGAIRSDTGFSLAPEYIFDTHFLNRGRLPRLFNLVAMHPDKTGIGLDEDTAAIIHDDGRIEAIGSGAVTIVEGRNLARNNARSASNGDRLTATGHTVTTLRHGQSKKIQSGRPRA